MELSSPTCAGSPWRVELANYRLSGKAERLLVLLACSLIFIFTIHQLTYDGLLPGNDPAVHLGKAQRIVLNERVEYSGVPWYPPLFHTFTAVLLLFMGSIDVTVAIPALRFVVASINVLLMLSTYSLCKRLLGRGVAITSLVFSSLLIPYFEIMFWGGYPNFLGIALISLTLFTVNTDFNFVSKTLILVLLAFALVLTHQLATLVFVLVCVPVFIFTSRKSKKNVIVSLAVFVSIGLAILAWYADILLRYAGIVIEFLFFSMKEYTYNIPYVSSTFLIETYGVILFLAIVGVPVTFIILRRRRLQGDAISMILWIAVPFFLSQSYLVGLYVPYERFTYFMAPPIVVFASAAAYSGAKSIGIVVSRTGKRRGVKLLQHRGAFTLLVLAGLFSTQFYLSVVRLRELSRFYGVAGTTSYEAAVWLGQNHPAQGNVVVPLKPGSWLGTISGYRTIEERNPLYGRNQVAETILNLNYEMENTRVLASEYVPGDSVSGFTIYLSVYNLWVSMLSIFDSDVYLNCIDTHDNLTVIPLSETDKTISFTTWSSEEAQMVSEYNHELFAIEKTITISGKKQAIKLEWKLQPRQNLSNIELKIFSFIDTRLNFTKAMIPGRLEWENPWDHPTTMNMSGGWAVSKFPKGELTQNTAALIDLDNRLLMIYEYLNLPDWISVGALSNRFIDALRVVYRFSNLTKGRSVEIAFSIFPYHLEGISDEPSLTTIDQILSADVDLPVQVGDFLTYIRVYNVTFILTNSERLLLNIKSSSAVDRVYDNEKIVVYKTKTNLEA